MLHPNTESFAGFLTFLNISVLDTRTVWCNIDRQLKAGELLISIT